jgi:hypothetical protein
MNYEIDLKQLSDISNAVTKMQYATNLLIETNPVLAKEFINKLNTITTILSEIIEVSNEQN